MKGKVTLAVLGGAAALTALCILVMAFNGLGFRAGRCIKTENGSCMLLMDNSPVVLSNHTLFDDPFGDYGTGDLLLVLHDGVNETYPGGTGAYFTLRLSRGTGGDVPREILDVLSEMGWIAVE